MWERGERESERERALPPGRACAPRAAVGGWSSSEGLAGGGAAGREERRPRAPPGARLGERKEREAGAEGRGGGGQGGRERGRGAGSEGGFIDRAILVKIFKMADGGAASQDESSSAAAAAAGNHYSILHIHIHTQARLPPAPPPRDLA